jgi:hypothetical protein
MEKSGVELKNQPSVLSFTFKVLKQDLSKEYFTGKRKLFSIA